MDIPILPHGNILTGLNPEIAAQVPNILDSNKVYAGFIAGMNGDFKNGNGHYNTSAGGTYGNFKVSKYSKLFQENAHDLLKAQIMNKDEVQFILAEAAVKGYITGDADTYYRTGIQIFNGALGCKRIRYY